MARGKKWEEKKLQYAMLTEVVRQGGFLIAVIIRFSAIPGHCELSHTNLLQTPH